MDTNSFLLGIGVTVIGGIVLYLLILMVERPDLEILPKVWKEKKWVGRVLDNIKYFSTDKGGEARVDGYDFMIYGISIRNKRRRFLPRKTAQITSTTLILFNQHGDPISDSREGRWWCSDLSSLDKLFVPESVDVKERRNIDIPEDVSRNLAISYCHLGQPAHRIFAIDSDRVGRFNSNEDRIKGHSPYYALIKFRGKNVAKDIKLEIVIDQTNLLIKPLRKFPFEVRHLT